MSSPSSLVMNPKPFESLNHFTVPCAIFEHLVFWNCCATQHHDHILLERVSQQKSLSRVRLWGLRCPIHRPIIIPAAGDSAWRQRRAFRSTGPEEALSSIPGQGAYDASSALEHGCVHRRDSFSGCTRPTCAPDAIAPSPSWPPSPPESEITLRAMVKCLPEEFK